VDNHREGYNQPGHEQVHSDYLVADNVVEAFDHNLLLETILLHTLSRPTNVLQPYCNRAGTSQYAVDTQPCQKCRKPH
jgi:hypothetical protein